MFLSLWLRLVCNSILMRLVILCLTHICLIGIYVCKYTRFVYYTIYTLYSLSYESCNLQHEYLQTTKVKRRRYSIQITHRKEHANLTDFKIVHFYTFTLSNRCYYSTHLRTAVCTFAPGLFVAPWLFVNALTLIYVCLTT